MTLDLPTADDRVVWDAWLSAYRMPAIVTADEIGLIESLAETPATAAELAERKGWNPEALKALLPMLSALGFLVPRMGRYQLTPAGRTYLLHDSPFYWGHAFTPHRGSQFHNRFHQAVTGRARGEGAAGPRFHGQEGRPADAWESGQVGADLARNIATFMHSHSVPAALGAARQGDFGGVSRVLDVGGGSGCFSIALAERFPHMRCTVMELPTMCELADGYIADAGLKDRVDTTSVDMFRAAWPTGYDAIFMSNIFHDWDLEINARLAESAFAALPPGGRIYLHEMLINDEGSGPLPVASFSMMMLLGTKGRQYSLAELAGILGDAGFADVSARDTYGYYSLVCGHKR